MPNNFRKYKDPSKKSFNLYNLFSGGLGEGKGVKKEDRITSYSVVNGVKLYGRNFANMFKLNLLYLFGNFPIIFFLFALSGNVSLPSLTQTNILYSSFRGVLLSGEYDPVMAALNGVIGYRTVNYVPTTATYVLFGLSALVLFTFGIVNVGCAYILRNIVKQEPIFFMSDFFYAIKRNWKQALPFGILDLLFSALLCYDVIFFYYNIGPFFNNICFYLSIALVFLYFIMRFYIYPMMLTFDLSIFKLFKNALIFTALGFKRNIMALIMMVLTALLAYGVFLTYAPLGMILPIVILISTLAFISMYAAFPKIKEIMIDPYYKDEPEEDPEAPIFRDMG